MLKNYLRALYLKNTGVSFEEFKKQMIAELGASGTVSPVGPTGPTGPSGPRGEKESSLAASVTKVAPLAASGTSGPASGTSGPAKEEKEEKEAKEAKEAAPPPAITAPPPAEAKEAAPPPAITAPPPAITESPPAANPAVEIPTATVVNTPLVIATRVDEKNQKGGSTTEEISKLNTVDEIIKSIKSKLTIEDKFNLLLDILE
jgi:hypothetical protein